MVLGSEPIGNLNWLEGSITFVKVLVLRKSYSRNNEKKKNKNKNLTNLAGMRLVMSSVLNLLEMEKT